VYGKTTIIFIRMYGNGNGKNINDVVDSMVYSKLDWAMQQVERTINKK
jgi:hypothetical protein